MSDADGDLVNAQNLGLADIETDPVPDNALPGPIGNWRRSTHRPRLLRSDRTRPATWGCPGRTC